MTRLTYSIDTGNAAAADDGGVDDNPGASTPPRGGDWVERILSVTVDTTAVHVGGRGAFRISDTTCLKKGAGDQEDSSRFKGADRCAACSDVVSAVFQAASLLLLLLTTVLYTTVQYFTLDTYRSHVASYLRYGSDVVSIPSCFAIASVDGVAGVTEFGSVSPPSLPADRLAAIILCYSSVCLLLSEAEQ